MLPRARHPAARGEPRCCYTHCGAHAKILSLSWLALGILIAACFRFSGRLDAGRSAPPPTPGRQRAVER